MREDTTSRNEADAADHAQTLGAHEHIGGGDKTPIVKPVCTVCQGGVRGYVCGPCVRNAATDHQHGREETGRCVRLACTCGHKGPWRSRTAYLLEKQLRSDDGEHLYAVRRESA